jgi:hypothetical protein
MIDPEEAQRISAFEKRADLELSLRIDQLYEAEIAKTKELVEEYSNTGIASGLRFVQKTADLVLTRYKTLQATFVEIFIRPLEIAPDQVTKTWEDWLRAKVRKVVGEQTNRARDVTISLCSSFGPVSRLDPFINQLQHEGKDLEGRLSRSITLLVLHSEASRKSSHHKASIRQDVLGTTMNPPKPTFEDPIPQDLEAIQSQIDYWANRLHEGTVGSEFRGNIESRLRELRYYEERAKDKKRNINFSAGPGALPDADPTIDIFISHSAADTRLAKTLIDLLLVSLPIDPKRIRCTSVNGYRLEGGAQADDQLRTEIWGAKVFIGLLTDHSISSTYVLFELGARWGAKFLNWEPDGGPNCN